MSEPPDWPERPDWPTNRDDMIKLAVRIFTVVGGLIPAENKRARIYCERAVDQMNRMLVELDRGAGQ